METNINKLKNHLGQEVKIKGWIANKRSSGSIIFLILRDGTGFVQAVVEKNKLGADKFSEIDKLGIESSVEVIGIVKEDARSPMGVELNLNSLNVIGISNNYPIAPKKHGVKFLLDRRHLWLRSKSQFATLKIRSEIIWALHEFFHNEGFVKFDGPMFTANEVEGGSTLFEVEYFGRSAYLTQSAQLHGEAGAMAFGKIYTFGPTFRAEKSKTRRHLTEFWMLEPEVAFYDWKDNIALQERMIKYVVKYCLENCTYELEILGRDLKKLENALKPFIWMHHRDAVKELNKHGYSLDERADIGADEEAVLTSMYDEFIVLHHMPAEIKAFYMQPDLEEGDNRVLCNDLLAPEGCGEIIGGSQRIHDLDLLEKRIREYGLDPKVFDWYFDLRRYGTVPHSGFGLGLERLVKYIAGVKHVRATIPFPRMINRLHP